MTERTSGDMMNFGLMGFGTVGSGVYEIISSGKAGKDYNIKKILVRDPSKPRKVSAPGELFTKDAADILEDEDIKLVICVMGGMEPEYTYIKQALSLGKSVVTANKEVIAAHMDELLDIARSNGAYLYFEASVGGGIPIISSLTDLIKLNTISQVTGILNGTTNFILTKISREHRDFADILKEAQEMGFAEADPSADVDGYDMMRKISILSAIAFGNMVDESNVIMRGIRNILLDDVLAAESYGYKIKFLGQGVRSGEGFNVCVEPALIKNDFVVGNVNEEYNVIMAQGDLIGKLCFMGKGAGKNATAEAVVSDVIKVMSKTDEYSSIKLKPANSEGARFEEMHEYYLRVSFNGYYSLSNTLDKISSLIKRNKIRVYNNMLFMITEAVNDSLMRELCGQLAESGRDVFFARIENNVL